ncbi:hypothetical protein C0993_012508 [Termitomyces sp. T159_Od127]|nr:hypothetical protein C0993_012508 [Termitomyces sp. T159_Od127]
MSHSPAPAAFLASSGSGGTDHGPNTVMKNRLQAVWNGIELLLKKVEKPLSGTPLQVPVGVTVSHNNDERKTQIERIKERLKTIVDVNDHKTDLEDLTRDFVQKLQDKLKELQEMSKKSTLEKIFNSEEETMQINNIYNCIDDATKDLQV